MNPKNNNKLAITVLLAAKNEELDISKCLESLRPAEKIYVLDSHSSDRTAEFQNHLALKSYNLITLAVILKNVNGPWKA